MPKINKIEYYGRTLLDLTGDSVTPETLAEGATAHNSAGEPITGVGKTTSVLYTEQALQEAQKKQARTNIGAELAGKDIPITAESTDGVSYTASVPWILELNVGARFTMLPNKLSTTLNPTLNVNGLGAKNLRCLTGSNNAETANGAFADWISAGKPIDVIYNGTYWITNMQRTSANALYGTLKIEGGGTGADNAEKALENLGGVPKAGDTMTGALVAQNNTNYTTKQVRNVFLIADGEPLPAGANGDICLVYIP